MELTERKGVRGKPRIVPATSGALLAVLAVFTRGVAGCGPAPGGWSEPAGASKQAERARVDLPRDESPHLLEGVEWWYLTGRLSSAEGREFGVLAVVFRSAVFPQNAHVGHYAVTDVSGVSFQYDQNLWLIPQSEAPHGAFHLTTGVTQMEGGGGRIELSARMTDGSWPLRLSLEDERGPLLHGAQGVVPYGTMGQQAYYYSRPRMRAVGTLGVDGESTEVTGTMWFDRQWGEAIVNPFEKWDWFSIRLDDGTDIMLFHFPEGEGCGTEREAVWFCTYWPAEAEAVSLGRDEIVVQTTAEWISPNTGVRYGAEWEVELATIGVRLAIKPVLAEQELDVRNSTLNVYWEGLCRVTGVRDGTPATGHAFVEMANGGSAEAAQ